MARLTKFSMVFLFAALSGALAQESSQNQQTPEDAFKTWQLVAWSSVQKPQPAPQPLPPRDTPIPQPDQQAEQPPKSPGHGQADQSPAEAFTGTIVKEGAEYVLKAARNSTYHLDEQGDLQRFENKNVRVTGNLDTSTNTIHVVKVELLP